MNITCPKCGHGFKPRTATAAAILGSKTSEAKAAASRLNGRKGGRPKERKS